MSGENRAPRQLTEDSLLLQDLLEYYDELADFHDSCAFFCDALAALLASSTEFERSTVEGVTSFSMHMKERASELKNAFRLIHERFNKGTDLAH
jgi:hypothetical protein